MHAVRGITIGLGRKDLARCLARRAVRGITIGLGRLQAATPELWVQDPAFRRSSHCMCQAMHSNLLQFYGNPEVSCMHGCSRKVGEPMKTYVLVGASGKLPYEPAT